ncbi:MAG: protoheme IX farnesyltransferase [Deltaproteobacteria bacterium]|nr:protoheme IX farnesyltransferase [Deltaproteobacteria bacterium]
MMFDYLNLTKPRISLLFAITGLTVFMMEGSLMGQPLKVALLVLAIFMTGGAANALNQYFERDRDKLMARTAKKRPLPQGKITPQAALIFIIFLASLGLFILAYLGNTLALLLGLLTIGFYSFFYTLYLKPKTPYNIVIGGIPGALGPLIADAAVTGSIGWPSFIMFLIVFFWTPPHFWALALACKDDYAKVGIPMLPVVAGEEATRRQILYYSFTLLPLTLSLYFIHAFGKVYLISSTILSVFFILGAIEVYRRRNNKTNWIFFAYSIVYLLLIFVMMMIDSQLK